MEIPQRMSFASYVGTLVINKLLEEPEPFLCPFVVVTLHPSSNEPNEFVSNASRFEEAVIDMDSIQYEACKYSQDPTVYTVLEVYFVGGIVHWKDRLPMVPVG